ncbi:lysosomal alpha-mannosidase-like [Ornithodoros turicata]|uniref:lysosomal alpha-mannosidase-like n=1 Tax=Ornithodoros turicata TaxID=34597 RepID=UPI00313A2F0A
MWRDTVAVAAASMLLLSGMLSLVLCSALAGVQHREAAERRARDDPPCLYQACHETKPGFLNVHIVSHTHNDVGWVHTVDFYYQHYVRIILDSVVEELHAHPDRRFTYVETAFFSRWWNEQTPQMQEVVRNFVDSGRLEFTSGGWSMNDEATTHYSAIIDQMTLGVRWLNDTFGKCARPRVGWQIDPFGHSREQASIFAQMGFDGYFLGRIHLDDKAWRQEYNQMEFLWETNKYLGEKGDIFTGILPNVYWPPKGFCFDLFCADDPVDEYNGEKRAKDFIDLVIAQSKFYATNHTVVTMGMDFHYKDAAKWFGNLDNLIRFVNAQQVNGSRVHVLYSTPSCYLKALLDSDMRWPEYDDDFFPYADRADAYWTGYFTSRPNFKFFARQANGFLAACKQLKVIGNVTDGDVETLSKALGVLQHHDAISGTEKQHVVEDYAYMTYLGIKQCENITSRAYQNLLFTDSYPAFDLNLEFCHFLNLSSCYITETSDEFFVFVYNPTSSPVRSYARLPVSSSGYEVKELPGQTLRAQVVPIASHVKRIPERRTTAQKELVFPVSLPPLGTTTYQVRKYQDFLPKDSEDSAVFVEEGETPAIDNGKYRLFVDPVTGLLNRILLLNTGMGIPFRQSFYYYLAYEGVQEKPSGAYAFNPASEDPIDLARNVNYSIVKGPLVQEIHQHFTPWVTQVIRLYKNEDVIEFDWVVGPIPFYDSRGFGTGKEVVSIFQTAMDTDSKFYTDSNGRQTMTRIRNVYRPWTKNITEPTSSNYYPVVSWIYLKNETEDLQLTVFPDRSQGGTSLRDGQIELMIHRRLQYDDGFGVEEPLNELGIDSKGLIAKGKHLVYLGTIADSERLLRTVSNRLVYAPMYSFSAKSRSLLDVPLPRVSGLDMTLPPNIHLLTLEPVGTDRLILRLEHQYPGVRDETLRRPVVISLKVRQVIARHGAVFRNITASVEVHAFTLQLLEES